MDERRANPLPAQPVRAERLAELFIDVSKQLGRLSSRARAGELSNARYEVLRIVLRRGPERMNRVAAAVGISPRSLTDLVDALAAEGYLRRTTDPHDRRSVLLELTAAGREAVRAGRQARLTQAAHVFDELDPVERVALERVLVKLSAQAASPQPPARLTLAPRPAPTHTA